MSNCIAHTLCTYPCTVYTRSLDNGEIYHGIFDTQQDAINYMEKIVGYNRKILQAYSVCEKHHAKHMFFSAIPKRGSDL